MKRSLTVILVLLGICALAVEPTSAQTRVDVDPAQIELSGVQGQSLARTLIVRASEDLAGLQLIAGELTGNQGAVLEPSVAPEDLSFPTDVPAGTVLRLPVSFDLSGNPAGVYTGELLLTYQGGSRIVPVRVVVKMQPWIPLIALVGGVALGVGVSSYRAKGRPRDEVMVRLGQIRTQMKVDEELHTLGRPFLARIEAALADVEGALEAQRWEEAQRAAEAANNVWTLWRRYRPDWIVQLTAYGEFVTWLAASAPESRYVVELTQAAADHLRGAPDLDGPQGFRAGLDPLRELANSFVILSGRLQALASMGPTGTAEATVYRQQVEATSPVAADAAEQLAKVSQRVTAAIAKLREAELEALLATYLEATPDPEGLEADDYRARIEALAPNAAIDYLELRIDLLNGLGSARSTGEQTTAAAGENHPDQMTRAIGLGAATAPDLMKTLPQVRVQALEEPALAASRPLSWFIRLTYGITVALLALAGFVVLYGTRADFGTSGAADIFAMLAWGFGAEATRSAISDMVQSWGIAQL